MLTTHARTSIAEPTKRHSWQRPVNVAFRNRPAAQHLRFEVKVRIVEADLEVQGESKVNVQAFQVCI